ncbi:MAG TPA: tyrosine-type recombinase/integrase [Stellaceae bacterium]|jgi:integrase
MSERVTKIGLDDVRQLGEDAILWETTLPGFGARRRRGNAAVRFFVFYRTQEGRQRWQTIGQLGALTPDTARKQARAILGEVAKGGDPAAAKKATRQAQTVGELCDAYLTDAEAGRLLTRRRTAKKQSTLATDRGRVERHIKPLLGKLPVRAITRDDVKRFMHAVAEGETAATVKTKLRGLARVSGGKGTATRTVGLLGAIFAYAVDQGVRSNNPVQGVMRFADGRRTRRLSNDEYASLGAALRQATAESIWPPAIAAAQFLALTGWRRGEALSLQWPDVDLIRRTATLADTKTGHSMRPLSQAACDVLRTMPQIAGALVFPATRGAGEMAGFASFWDRIMGLGELPRDITPHVLRHSFASLASDLGYSELTIGALVGHKGQTITSRYVHSADAVLLAAADAVADRTAALMVEPNGRE